jgi:hypothetical protein
MENDKRQPPVEVHPAALADRLAKLAAFAEFGRE